MITQFRWEVRPRFFFQKLRMSIRQVIWNFELNPSKGSGVIKIPKKFPFWGGEGFRAKKNFVLSLVDQMVTAYKFWSQSAQKSGQMHRCTDRYSIALRDRIWNSKCSKPTCLSKHIKFSKSMQHPIFSYRFPYYIEGLETKTKSVPQSWKENHATLHFYYLSNH